MTGGLVQLASYSEQNCYHTSNPQMTFFKKTYMKHTNYSKEQIQVNPDNNNNNNNFGITNTMKFGTRNKIRIIRNGDLI